MYAWRVLLACAIIISTGLERLVRAHENVQQEKTRNIRNDIKRSRKNLDWTINVGFNEQSETLRTLHGKVPRRKLGLDDLIHKHHNFYLNHNDLDNGHGQEEKLNSPIRRHYIDGVKPFTRKRYKKQRTRTTERKDKVKNGGAKIIQEIFPTYKTAKRFMVVRGPKTSPSAKRKRFHFSRELVNALRLVLDKRNSFKKDANILDLAKALQSRDQESNRFRNNTITTGVSRGFTRNGQRVRLVRVKDPGYNEHKLRLKNPVYRSKIVQDSKHSHSALVNPTELGASILKLLFGKKARYVTKPKYRHLVGAARPNMKYLEGYGSKQERAELEKEIEKENQLILLKGVKKHELEKTLAKSISNLIRAMNQDKVDIKGKARKAEPKVNENQSQKNVGNPQENSGQKTSVTQDHIGTRKSWVLLKMPKNNEEVAQDKMTQFHEAEVENDNPSKVSTHQIATLGKKNNELSDIKVVQQHKPHVESSYEDIVSEHEKKAPELAKYTHTDTESRTVPQISYNLNGIKSSRDAQKLSESNGLALTLRKILKGIQESVKELKAQNKRKGASENSAVMKLTTPESKTSHDSTTSMETSSLGTSTSVAKIQDLMVAVNKLLGTDSRSSQLPSQSGMAGIPNDQGVQNVPTMDNVDATAARRFVDGIRASRDPLQLRPSIGYFDEPITTPVTSREFVGEDKSLDNVLFESDELATQRDREASLDAIKLKEDLEAFAERGLNTHNKYRELHHAQKLKWSDDLATQAEKMAYDMAMKGTIEKTAVASALGYGENVAKITGAMFNKAGEEATNLWYAEIANYSFSDPRLSPETDSFTQVVWKGTLKLGMGCARDLQTNDLYVVALYDPKGNDPVGLRSNVLNKGGVTEDVYASIFKRHRLQGK